MDELQDLLSFDWAGTKKDRYTRDKWGDNKNCRKLKNSKATAQALLTGPRQLDSSKRFKLIAVDLDNRDNWDEVVETYKALDLPQTLTVLTPSNGYHMFFWIIKSIPAQNISDERHCKHFELKGDNNNITAPNSIFDCGAAYRVVRDYPIALLLPLQAQRLCKYRQEPRMPHVASDFVPDRSAVENEAYRLDERARKNPRGWQIRCPEHEDRRSSAVLFSSGWLWCSGCGHKEQLVKKEQSWKIVIDL
jgi:hypothetical protein